MLQHKNKHSKKLQQIAATSSLFDPFACLALILDCHLNLVLLGFVNSLENIVNTTLG